MNEKVESREGCRGGGASHSIQSNRRATMHPRITRRQTSIFRSIGTSPFAAIADPHKNQPSAAEGQKDKREKKSWSNR